MTGPDRRPPGAAPPGPTARAAAPTLADAIAAAAARLGAAGVPDARTDVRLLAGQALGLDRAGVLAARDRPLTASERDRIDVLVARRAAREPVSRILGRREFWSLDFALSPATLDPRPDSETVVAAALGLVPDRRAPLRLLDLGTGTGCLLLALLSELPAAWGLGIDRAEAAVRTARDNARRLGLADRAAFLVGDWAAALHASGGETGGGFDLIVANPPYVTADEIDQLAPEVARFDPPAALDGGADGLAAYRALAGAVPGLLAPEGAVVLEVGDGQAAAVTSVMAAAGLRAAAPCRDLGGKLRCVILRSIRQKSVGIPPGCR